jgi:hypothetical protein
VDRGAVRWRGCLREIWCRYLMTLLVTACTLRKRVAPATGLRARDLRAGLINDVAGEWLRRVAATTPVLPACRLYCGRSFQEAVQAARAIGTPPAIVSAGLGVVDGEDLLPAYSLTVTPGSIDDVTARSEPRASVGVWWANLIEGRRSLVDRLRSETGLIVLALPKTYLTMVAEDLAALPNTIKPRLRIISGSDVSRLSEEIAAVQMPYDDRFDGLESPNPGTRADFASRTARHFVEVVLAARPFGSAAEHWADVERAFAGSRRSPRRVRARASDEEIATLLRLHWNAARGQTARLLRVLRDELGIACEQGRLARLATKVRNEQKAM